MVKIMEPIMGSIMATLKDPIVGLSGLRQGCWPLTSAVVIRFKLSESSLLGSGWWLLLACGWLHMGSLWWSY